MNQGILPLIKKYGDQTINFILVNKYKELTFSIVSCLWIFFVITFVFTLVLLIENIYLWYFLLVLYTIILWVITIVYVLCTFRLFSHYLNKKEPGYMESISQNDDDHEITIQ